MESSFYKWYGINIWNKNVNYERGIWLPGPFKWLSFLVYNKGNDGLWDLIFRIFHHPKVTYGFAKIFLQLEWILSVTVSTLLYILMYTLVRVTCLAWFSSSQKVATPKAFISFTYDLRQATFGKSNEDPGIDRWEMRIINWIRESLTDITDLRERSSCRMKW